MLFDIIAKLNREITELMRERHPDIDHIPMVIGTTDGVCVTIHFADKVIWDSDDWPFNDKIGESDMLELIEFNIRKEITEYMGQMRRFTWGDQW